MLKRFSARTFLVTLVTRAVLPQMRQQRSGHVINISSIGGYQSYIGWGVYCATKFAVEGLTEALAMELAPLGIFATTVEPGFFRTDFLDAKSLTTAPTPSRTMPRPLEPCARRWPKPIINSPITPRRWARRCSRSSTRRIRRYASLWAAIPLRPSRRKTFSWPRNSPTGVRSLSRLPSNHNTIMTTLTKKDRLVWFITGTSQGFGRELVRAALDRGDSVVATSRQPETVAAAFPNAADRLLALSLDLSNPAQIAATVDAPIKRFSCVSMYSSTMRGTGCGRQAHDALRQRRPNYRNRRKPDPRKAALGHDDRVRCGRTHQPCARCLCRMDTRAASLLKRAIASSLSNERLWSDPAAGSKRTEVSYHQPGDPVKLAAAIVHLAGSPKPPVHLPLGTDTLKHYREKTEAFDKEIAEWHDVITSTDHDVAAR